MIIRYLPQLLPLFLRQHLSLSPALRDLSRLTQRAMCPSILFALPPSARFTPVSYGACLLYLGDGDPNSGKAFTSEAIAAAQNFSACFKQQEVIILQSEGKTSENRYYWTARYPEGCIHGIYMGESIFFPILAPGSCRSSWPFSPFSVHEASKWGSLSHIVSL